MKHEKPVTSQAVRHATAYLKWCVTQMSPAQLMAFHQHILPRGEVENINFIVESMNQMNIVPDDKNA